MRGIARQLLTACVADGAGVRVLYAGVRNRTQYRTDGMRLAKSIDAQEEACRRR